MQINFVAGNILEFEYRNHEGSVETRRIILESIGFGTNKWYTSPSFFINGLCHKSDKRAGERRSFATSHIVSDIRRA